jgi:hypothetical protein
LQGLLLLLLAWLLRPSTAVPLSISRPIRLGQYYYTFPALGCVRCLRSECLLPAQNEVATLNNSCVVLPLLAATAVLLL